MGWVSGGNSLVRRPAALQIIGQDIRQPNTGLGLTTAVEAEGRIPLGPFPFPLYELRVPVSGKYLTSAFAVANIPKIHTMQYAIELINGIATTAPSALFGGNATKVVNPGDAWSTSDNWVAVNGVIPANTPMNVKYNCKVPTAGIVTAPDLSQAKGLSGPYAATCQWYAAGATNPNSINSVGAISTVGASGNQLAPPQIVTAVLGKFDYLKTSAFIIGNSKFTGTGNGVTTDQFSGKSAISRALYDLRIPSASVALAGTTVAQWAGVDPVAYELAGYTDNVIIGDPINDIVTGGATLAQIQANYTTLVGKIRAINPTVNIWITQPEPATTTQSFTITSLTSVSTTATATVADTSTFTTGDSIVITGATPTAYNGTYTITVVNGTTFTYTFAGGTSPATGSPVFTDGYTTVARQTGQAGAVFPGSVRDQFLAWLPTQITSGLLIKGILDGNPAVEQGGTGASGKWKPRKTLDGLHDTDQGYTDEAALFKSNLLAGGIIPNTGAF